VITPAEDVLDLRAIVERKRIEQASAVGSLKTARELLMQADDYYTEVQEAHALIQLVAQAVQQEAHQQIAGVVSQCLESVFDDPYEFQIGFDRKRGRTEAELLFVREDIKVDPLTGSGGGAVDVAAFALRLACLVLSRPAIRPLLVLDEPWKHLSTRYRPRLRVLVQKLAEDFGVQFVIVTHSDEFKIGKIVDLGDGDNLPS
jgi:DNA repair exonuclease SbcCD ATPase subunit